MNATLSLNYTSARFLVAVLFDSFHSSKEQGEFWPTDLNFYSVKQISFLQTNSIFHTSTFSLALKY